MILEILLNSIIDVSTSVLFYNKKTFRSQTALKNNATIFDITAFKNTKIS